MDCFKKTSIAAVLMLIFGMQAVEAQSDIDTNRMNRDINIMENVLEEMFKTQWAAQGNTVRAGTGSWVSFGRSEEIRGTYLRDYGIIFTIAGGPPAFVIMSDSDGEKSSYRFQYGDNEEGEPVTQESITDRMVEFLQDYGSTIGQLSSGDRVMVIYKSKNSGNSVTFIHSSSDEQEKTKRQQSRSPTISVVATKRNLQAYRSGDINSDEFRNRLDISTAKAGKANQKDMRIMAGIFETAFEEADDKSFRIRGSVDHLQLDNFGALFSFDIRYGGSRSHFDLSGLHESIEILRKNIDQTQREVEESRAAMQDERRAAIDSLRSAHKKKAEENRAQQKQQAITAYEQFVADLKEYLVDYGRTLRSVDSDQQILVSVSLSSRYDEIPERIDLQIKKSVLESMDQGSMNRNQTMEQIQVREY